MLKEPSARVEYVSSCSVSLSDAERYVALRRALHVNRSDTRIAAASRHGRVVIEYRLSLCEFAVHTHAFRAYDKVAATATCTFRCVKVKGKAQVLDIALLHDEHMLRSALQSPKWQPIGMS